MAYEDVKAEMRLAAIEQTIRFLVANLLHQQFGTVEEAQAVIDRMIAKAGSETTPETDPAQSDLIAGEYEDAMRALLSGVAEMVAAAAKRR